jgi:hypothetical protein
MSNEISLALTRAASTRAALANVSLEGFWTVEDTTPYSIDPAVRRRADMVAARLDAFPGVDYWMYTNAQRLE